MSKVIQPCGNCGSKAFVEATPGDGKGALTRVHTGGDRLKFQADAGTPVDIYVCEQCGMLRLFAIER